jgi:hypothetical protein
MHLVVGEWIATNRAVPYEEPFAWTRMGDPYFAYSWLPQLLLFGTIRVAGPIGLHLLAGLIGIGIVLASARMARALGLGAARATLLGASSGYVALESTPFLRPQLLMFVLVPLSWTLAVSYLERPASRWRTLAAVVLVSALAANTHISFPVVAAPLALLLVRPGPSPAVGISLVAATVLGWAISPYVLVWPEVFRLNFVRNAITTHPGLVGELQPGFRVRPWLGIALATLPLWSARALATREKVVYWSLWLAGLATFAVAFKGLGPWWWCASPLLVAGLARISAEPLVRRGPLVAGVLVLLLAVVALPNVLLLPRLAPFEGSNDARRLPSIKAFAAEPLAQWMETRIRGDVRGRLLTTFEYGSYLRWRLPSLSESIDSRNVFPDSVVLSGPAASEPPRLGPWRAADVAIFPVGLPLAATLDSSPDWTRVMVAPPPPWAPEAPRAGLWIRRAWMTKATHSGEAGTSRRAATDASGPRGTPRGRP